MRGRHKSPEKNPKLQEELTPNQRYDNLVKKLSNGPKQYIDEDGVSVKIEVDNFESASIIRIKREKLPEISTDFRFSCNYRWIDGFVWWYTDHKVPKMHRTRSWLEEGPEKGQEEEYLSRVWLNKITEKDAKDALKLIEKRVEDAEKYEKKEKEKEDEKKKQEEEKKRQENRKFLDYAEQKQKDKDERDIEELENYFW